MMRKVIQIAVAGDGSNRPDLIALCNDGSIWQLGYEWSRLPDIPRDEPATESEETHEQLIARLAPGFVECRYEEADAYSSGSLRLRTGLIRDHRDAWGFGRWEGNVARAEYIWLRSDPSVTVRGEGMPAVNPPEGDDT